jgi:hypothetical protein
MEDSMSYCPSCEKETSATHADMRVLFCDQHLLEAEAEYRKAVMARRTTAQLAQEIVTSLLGVLLVAWGCW